MESDVSDNETVGNIILLKIYLESDLYYSPIKHYVALTDMRVGTTVQTMTYSADLTNEAVLKQIISGVKGDDGKSVSYDVSSDFKVEGLSLNAGTHTTKVTFLGNNKYAASAPASVKYTITKANATITVLNQEVEYDNRSSLKEPVSINPADASFISFCAGLDMTSGAYIQLNMPNVLDQDKLDDAIDGILSLAGSLMSEEDKEAMRTEIKNRINGVFDGLQGDIPLSQLTSRLNDALKAVEELEDKYNFDLPLGFDVNSISMLASVLNEVATVMPEGVDVTVRLTFDGSVIPNNAGVYLVGGVTSDPNYNTTFSTNNLGYLVIKPRTVEKTLAFNEKDQNGLYTLGTIANRDLGSKVVEDSSLNKRLHNLFIGVDADGNPVLKLVDADAKDTAEVRKAGTYTQIAFLMDLGNEINYAKPIIRQITVVPDLVVVKFIDENGNENNERVFTYDGKAHAMTAKVYSRGGAELPAADQNRITYNYAGIEGDGEGYLSSSAPIKAGVYAVTATYKNADSTVYGAAVGTMIIKPSDDATITVDKETYATQGTKVHLNNLVHSAPSEAAKTVITTAVNVSGDFSKQGVSALSGIVNVDFPTRLDNLLTKAGMDLSKPLSSDGLRKVFSSALSKAGVSDSSLINEAAALIDQLPANVNLTFNNDVVYDDIGVYLVIGAITDPDYTLKSDYGIVVITPNVTEAELKWNHDDVNGIITRPVLTTKGILDASAYVNGATTADETLTGKIRYLFIDLSGDAQLATYTTPAQITKNGVYFQLAYIYDEISADIAIVKPISRIFALVPQDVDIAIAPAVTTVDKTPYDMIGNNHITVTKRDASPVQPNCLHLYYTGVDSEGNTYNSSESPTAVGEYTVLALYVERDNAGKLRAAQTSLTDIDLNTIKYVGAGYGYLTVLPEDTILPDDPIDPGIGDDVNDVLNGLPQTGDNSSMALWVALLSISAAALVICRKRKANA